jgi:hypothetical protein
MSVDSDANKDSRFPGLFLTHLEPGRGKYIYACISRDNGDSVNVMRQDVSGEYHIDVAGPLKDFAERNDLECEVTGGGRIEYDVAKKIIFIYGYSQLYGPGDHDAVSQLLQKVYPDHVVNWSSMGY